MVISVTLITIYGVAHTASRNSLTGTSQRREEMSIETIRLLLEAMALKGRSLLSVPAV